MKIDLPGSKFGPCVFEICKLEFHVFSVENDYQLKPEVSPVENGCQELSVNFYQLKFGAAAPGRARSDKEATVTEGLRHREVHAAARLKDSDGARFNRGRRDPDKRVRGAGRAGTLDPRRADLEEWRERIASPADGPATAEFEDVNLEEQLPRIPIG